MRKIIFPLLAAFVWSFSGSALAADYVCADLVWGDWTVDHPEVASACDSVVVRDGVTYAKFNATFNRAFKDGSVSLRLHKPDGGFVVDTFTPPEGFMLSLPAAAGGSSPALAGGETPFQRTPPGQSPFGQLPSGADIRLYVPEGRGFSLPAPEPEVQVAEVEEVEPYVAPEPEPVMPTTASHLPLIGLLGGMFVMLGGILARVRRRS